MRKLDLYDSMLTKIHQSLQLFLRRFSFPANGGCLELYRTTTGRKRGSPKVLCFLASSKQD